jgi:fucose 4-O-acetylase-like acetyltransferase
MIILVIVLHAGIFYAPVLENVWLVTDPQKIDSLGLMVMYLNLFIMFILFFISGYFLPSSIKNRGTVTFIISKFKRLIIPWILAVFTLIPAYKAIFLYSRGLPSQEWYSYFHIFTRPEGDMASFADNPSMSWLWFLPLLFVFQLVYFMLQRSVLKKIKISFGTGTALTLILGIAYSVFISEMGLAGWFSSPVIMFQNERLLVYFMIFLLGTLANRINIFEKGFVSRPLTYISYILIVLSVAVYTPIAINFLMNLIEPGRDHFFIAPLADNIAFYTSQYTAMMSILYVLLRSFYMKLNKPRKILMEMAGNSYYVYIIHMVIAGGFALLLLNISIHPFIKFTILVLLTILFSNVVVSAYNRTIKTILYTRLTTIVIFLSGILLSIVVYSKQIDLNSEYQEKPVVEQAELMSIHLSALKGNTMAIRQHIENGSNLEEKEPTVGSTPLITAALFGRTEVVEMLIEAGVNINYQNHKGSTALHTAAFFCYTDIVDLLLKRGANRTIKNNDGFTALESVTPPFSAVKSVYDYFRNSLGPLGLELDYEKIKQTRPVIANILQDDMKQ